MNVFPFERRSKVDKRCGSKSGSSELGRLERESSCHGFSTSEAVVTMADAHLV